jgi:hypothetical protein
VIEQFLTAQRLGVLVAEVDLDGIEPAGLTQV